MRRRRLPWAQAVAALCVTLAVACHSEPPWHLYRESFEDLCDGTPCGWERASGGPEQATWVETVHPGEHALRLTGEVVVRGPASDERARGGEISMRVAIRCDSTSSLSTTVVLEDSLGGHPYTAVIPATPEWTSLNVFLVPSGERMDASVAAVVLTKRGAGSCEIGDLVIDDDPLFFTDGC